MTLPMVEGVSRPLSHHGGVDRAPWSIVSEELRIETPFATFYVEELVDDQERRYEWARIEKPDSLLLLIEDNGDLLLPPPHFVQALGHGAKISLVVALKVPTELPVQRAGSPHASLESH